MNPAVDRGLAAHIERHRQRIADGRVRLGWKVAFNPPAIQERLGLSGSLVAGLTRSTLLEAGSPYSIAGARFVALEAEVAVRLAADIEADAPLGAIAQAARHWAAAIEVVDFDRPLEELETVLAEGVFHRALVVGPWRPSRADLDLTGIRARVTQGGALVCDVDAGTATGDAREVLRHLTGLLARHGEGLAEGDVVILGSMNPLTPARAGATFSLALTSIGDVSLAIDP